MLPYLGPDRHFRGKADIDQPTIPAGSVKNDPNSDSGGPLTTTELIH